MCGLTGFIDIRLQSSGEELAAIVTRMADTIRHRGPDDSGAWTDSSVGYAVGFRRLAIIDLSPAGHQPMASASGRFVIAFNGEIYNFSELRPELEQNGYPFHSHSDTEVMLAAFEAWGVEQALKRFNGMFAFAVWDRQEKTLYLARDRMGEKPLYYGWVGPTFLFGSELKALRAHPNFNCDINRDALTLYLRHNYIPSPYSIYVGINKLPPATYLRITPGIGLNQPAPIPYWRLRGAVEHGQANPLRLSDEEAIARLDALLRDAVKIRMQSDVPLGAFLSGGIDSSTVVALMQAQSSQPVKTFTIGFHEDGYNEAVDAKEVACHLHTEHTELYVTPEDAMAVIPKLPALYDEPFSDSSQIPTFLVSELTRRKVTVSLSGDGGDELFGGYNRYALGETIWRKVCHIPTGMRGRLASALTMVSPRHLDVLTRYAAPLMPKKFRYRNPADKMHKLADLLTVPDLETMYRGLVSHWNDPDSVVIGANEPETTLSNPECWPDLCNFTHRMMYLDAMTYLPDDILVKVDRASMGVSLEARVPLIDHRIVEFIWSLPIQMKVRDGQSKWLLRRVLYQYVPPSLIERPKMGFGVPIDSWLRGPLRDWAESLLNERRLRTEGYFDPQAVRKKWEEHISRSRNWQYHLWDILMFQAWLSETRK